MTRRSLLAPFFGVVLSLLLIPLAQASVPRVIMVDEVSATW